MEILKWLSEVGVALWEGESTSELSGNVTDSSGMHDQLIDS